MHPAHSLATLLSKAKTQTPQYSFFVVSAYHKNQNLPQTHPVSCIRCLSVSALKETRMSVRCEAWGQSGDWRWLLLSQMGTGCHGSYLLMPSWVQLELPPHV